MLIYFFYCRLMLFFFKCVLFCEYTECDHGSQEWQLLICTDLRRVSILVSIRAFWMGAGYDYYSVHMNRQKTG